MMANGDKSEIRQCRAADATGTDAEGSGAEPLNDASTWRDSRGMSKVHGNGRSSTPGERADTATKRLADMVENVFVKSKPVEKRAHAEPSATPLVLQQTLSAWVGLLLNGTIDVTFAPWFIITALNVRKENPGALITAVSLLIDGLISLVSWHLLKKKRSTLVVWLLVTLSNLGTLHTVVQIRLSEFPVPENVVLPQTLYMGVLQLLCLVTHGSSALAGFNIALSFLAAIVIAVQDTVAAASDAGELLTALAGRADVLQYFTLMMFFSAAAVLPSMMQSNWFLLLSFLGTMYRELTFLATGTTPQYPLNGGLNLTLGLLNFGMGYLLHKMKQQQELIIGDLYPKDVAIALAQSKVHSYVSKLLRTDKDDEEEFLSHSLNPPYNKYAPMCTVMFMDVVDFTALSGQVDSQSVMNMLHELFCKLDRACLRSRLYKLDTVGDCYIALTGLDDASGDATRVLEFAIRAVLEAAAMVLPNGAPLSVRVGMHTGPVTAGVVGLVRKKFTLLGNTVNVASRMESTSEPNTVHITESTFDALSASHQRLFEDGRRDVEVKGKGTMTTYRFNVMRDRLPCDMQFCDAELSGSLDRSRAASHSTVPTRMSQVSQGSEPNGRDD